MPFALYSNLLYKCWVTYYSGTIRLWYFSISQGILHIYNMLELIPSARGLGSSWGCLGQEKQRKTRDSQEKHREGKYKDNQRIEIQSWKLPELQGLSRQESQTMKKTAINHSLDFGLEPSFVVTFMKRCCPCDIKLVIQLTVQKQLFQFPWTSTFPINIYLH